MSVLADRLKYIREKYNYQQKRVAEALGISNVQLSRYESGDRTPDNETLTKIADFFEVTTDYLLGRTDNPKGFAIDDATKKFFGYSIKRDDQNTYDSLTEINKLIKQFGIEQMGFFDIEKWKQFTPEDVEELRKHFEWVAHKAKERNEEKK